MMKGATYGDEERFVVVRKGGNVKGVGDVKVYIRSGL